MPNQVTTSTPATITPFGSIFLSPSPCENAWMLVRISEHNSHDYATLVNLTTGHTWDSAGLNMQRVRSPHGVTPTELLGIIKNGVFTLLPAGQKVTIVTGPTPKAE